MNQQMDARVLEPSADSRCHRRRVVIIGAGIAGLSAAYAARRTDPHAEVIVLERAADVGGKAQTLQRDGWLIESGPGSFTNTEASFLDMLQQLGHDRLPANAAAARRFIYHHGSMKEMATHPLRLLRSGLLSPLGILRIAVEPWVPPRRVAPHADPPIAGVSDEESLWSFARRRLGPEAADRLVAPMALGIYAGDAKRLSVNGAFPRVVALEAEYGSLIRGAMALKRKQRAAKRAASTPAQAKSGSATGPGISSFTNGMQSLPLLLAGRPGVVVRCGISVRRIIGLPHARNGSQALPLRVEDANGHSWDADAVVVATEPYAAAELLRELDGELARELNAIRCPPVTVVALGYPPSVAAGAPVGFGSLVCRGEGVRMLGALWESHIFAGRAPKDHLLVRIMFGGAVDPEAARLDEDELVRLARVELEKVTGIRGTPVLAHVRRWERAIPQYEVGHLSRVARIEAGLQQYPGLFLAGNGLRGVSFARASADGIAQGTAAARFAHVRATRGA